MPKRPLQIKVQAFLAQCGDPARRQRHVRPVALLAALLVSSAALAQAPSPERAVVPLEPAEREFVLREMRDFLVMLEQLSAGLARGDFDAVAAAAAPLGTRGDKGRMPPAIAAKLPPGFRAMARSAHEQIDAIAADAARRDLQHSLGQAGRLLATCNACHAIYRFPN
jgi:cytochrome c556